MDSGSIKQAGLPLSQTPLPEQQDNPSAPWNAHQVGHAPDKPGQIKGGEATDSENLPTSLIVPGESVTRILESNKQWKCELLETWKAFLLLMGIHPDDLKKMQIDLLRNRTVPKLSRLINAVCSENFGPGRAVPGLKAEKLVQALFILNLRYAAEAVNKGLHTQFAAPALNLVNKKLSDNMELIQAFQIFNSSDSLIRSISHLALELGVKKIASIQCILTENNSENKLAEFLWLANQEKVLTYQNACIALQHIGYACLAGEIIELLGDNSQLPERTPDYKVHSNEAEALSQVLSMRDLTDILLDCAIDPDSLTEYFRPQPYGDDWEWFEKRIINRVLDLKWYCNITAKSLVDYLNSQSRILAAAQLVADLTGQKPDRVNMQEKELNDLNQALKHWEQQVGDSPADVKKEDRLKSFGLALGIPEAQIVIKSLTSYDDILSLARDLNRGTVENIVHAVQEIFPAETLESICERVPCLKGVKGKALPIH